MIQQSFISSYVHSQALVADRSAGSKSKQFRAAVCAFENLLWQLALASKVEYVLDCFIAGKHQTRSEAIESLETLASAIQSGTSFLAVDANVTRNCVALIVKVTTKTGDVNYETIYICDNKFFLLAEPAQYDASQLTETRKDALLELADWSAARRERIAMR